MKLITQITPDPVTGNPREAELHSLEFDRDFEINIKIDVYEKNNEGERLFDIAGTLQNELQRAASKEKHFPVRLTYTTKGSMVNAQGEVVSSGGVLTERDFLFMVSNAQLQGLTNMGQSDSAMETIRKFVELKIQEISARGQN